MCDHVGIMNQGKVLLERSLAELQDNTVKLQVVLPRGTSPGCPAELTVLHALRRGPGAYLHPPGRRREST